MDEMTQQRHKHYQCIRALADGWEIEYFDIDCIWTSTRHPSFSDGTKYRIVPDAEGWLPWYATEDSQCPVEGDAYVQIATSIKNPGSGLAKNYEWRSNTVYPITRYRIVNEHDTPRDKRIVTKIIWVFSDGSTEEE